MGFIGHLGPNGAATAGRLLFEGSDMLEAPPSELRAIRGSACFAGLPLGHIDRARPLQVSRKAGALPIVVAPKTGAILVQYQSTKDTSNDNGRVARAGGHNGREARVHCRGDWCARPSLSRRGIPQHSVAHAP